MNKDEAFELLIGFYSYDVSGPDFGIHDDVLKAELDCFLDSLSDEEYRVLISEFVRVKFVSEKAITDGYGFEDAKEFLDWLEWGFN